MADTLKVWTKPQLIVLTRGTSAENILTHCKIKNPNNPAIDGPTTTNAQDRCSERRESNCKNCQARAFSGS